jgi:hypothetical protein
LAARTDEQVTAAFESQAPGYSREFVPRLAHDIQNLINGRGFPQREKAQIGFIADSMAGRPNVTFRSSRDICSKERSKQKAMSPHKIIRRGFYIECEFGYEGPARHDACPKCSAPIPPSLGVSWANPSVF